jgi:hypothetical protein
MATSLEQILGKTINSTKELRDEIKRLQDELVRTEAGTAQWDATSQKLVAAQERLTSVTRANKVETQAATDSIVGMEKEYKSLYNQYKLLTEEERNSPFGKKMAESLNELSNKLNTTKKEVGNFKDNIGRYTESAVEAFGQMGISVGALQGPLKLANGGFQAFNKTLLANPLVWIIAALKVIIGVFNKVKDAIMSNEESQMALNEAMSAFQPIIDAVQNALDKMGQVVVKVIGWLADAFRKVREIGAAVTDFLGITDGANKKVKEQNKLYQDLAKSKNEYTKAQRDSTKLNASQEAEVKTLLDQAAATTDQKEKLDLLNQAKEIQNQITERKIALAEENLRIMQIETSLTANDAATNDKLAQAEAAVAQAKAEGAAKTKEMSSQIAGLTKSTDTYTEKLKKEKEELNDLLKTIEENSKTELQKLEEKYKKEKALLEKYGKDTTKLTYQYEKERAAIMHQQWREALEASQKLLTDAADTEKELLDLKAAWAKSDIEGARKLVQSTQEFNEKYKESAKLTAEEIEDSWKEIGSLFNIPIKSYEDALLMLAVLDKRYKEAVKAQDDYGKKSVMDSNNAAEIAKEVELLNYKISLMNDETLSEEQKVELIKAKEQELFDFKQQNILNELNLQNLTNEEKLALLKEYYDREKTMRDQAVQDAKEAAEKEREAYEQKYDSIVNNIDINVGLLDSIGALTDAISQNIERTMDDEKATKESVEKKKKQLKALQAVQLAVTLAAIAGETASGIMALWKGYAGKTAANNTLVAPPAIAAANAIDLASTIAQTVGLATMGAANMAASIGGYISTVKSIGGGNEGGNVEAVAPAQIDTTAYTYTRQLQTDQEQEALNAPIWVSVTDIERGLNNAKVRDEESTF